MKNVTLLIFILVIIFSCNSPKKDSEISGIFRIESKSIKNPKIDTFYADQNQVKVYTDDFYAYTNLQDDSTASFGIGYYDADGNLIKEHNMYSTSALDSPFVFNLRIEKSDQGYKQTIDQMKINGMPTKLVEQYVTIPAVGKSPLDGIWKLNRYCKVIGKDTSDEKRVQYKIFHKGYFMFVQDMKNHIDSSKLRSGFGFGHFDYQKDKVIEINLFSNYPSIIDKQIKLQVDFQGDDSFYQILPSEVDSTAVIEFYTRVKKSKK